MLAIKAQAENAISYLIWSLSKIILWTAPLMMPIVATATLHGKVTSFPPYQKSKPVATSGYSPEINALATGKLLIASRDLNDTHFSHTVILLINYDRKGAMGLVINMPTEVTLATAFPDIQGLREKDDLIFIGGPVSQNRLFLLLQADVPIEDAHPVVDDMYVSISRKVLERVANDRTSSGRWRLYVGYAGWKAGQLENEVSRGDWHVLPADAEIVFDTPSPEIWPTLIQRGPVKWLWRQGPLQPVYGGGTEGFDTVDLRDTRTLATTRGVPSCILVRWVPESVFNTSITSGTCVRDQP